MVNRGRRLHSHLYRRREGGSEGNAGAYPSRGGEREDAFLPVHGLLETGLVSVRRGGEAEREGGRESRIGLFLF